MFRESLKPVSSKLIKKPVPSLSVNTDKVERADAEVIKQTPPQPGPSSHRKRKPSAMILDSSTYEAICFSRTTRPTNLAPKRQFMDHKGNTHTRDIVVPAPSAQVEYIVKSFSR